MRARTAFKSYCCNTMSVGMGYSLQESIIKFSFPDEKKKNKLHQVWKNKSKNNREDILTKECFIINQILDYNNGQFPTFEKDTK